MSEYWLEEGYSMNEFYKEIGGLKMNNSSYDENILIEGCQYTIGTNDGKEFKKVSFVGLKQLNGKPMMVFKTDEDKQISVNPSFHSFIVEEETEMNPVTQSQAGWDIT